MPQLSKAFVLNGAELMRESEENPPAEAFKKTIGRQPHGFYSRAYPDDYRSERTGAMVD
ncbi:MAG: hypothetical protein LIP28_00035 [Deltaproteobacteria bacterium]|nr:hypothetical protein [Deltaproteobacteria bacterium]